MKKIIFLVLVTLFSLQAQSFSTGQVYLRLTDAGSTLFGSPDQQSLQVTRISLLVSGNQYQVFDYLNDANSSDTTAITIDTVAFGNYQVRSTFDNSYSFAPPAYSVELNAYGWTNSAFTISHYHITNIDSTTYDAKVGFEVLPFINNSYGNETVEYYGTGEYLRMHKDTIDVFVGMKILSSTITSLYAEDWVSGYNKSDSALYNNIFYGSIIDTFTAADSGSVLFPSVESQSIAPGTSIDLYIALASGISELQLDSNMTAAEEEYITMITTGVFDKELPLQVKLEQNYPNPFNPSTVIAFTLSKQDYVELDVFNSLGQHIQQVVSKEMSAGQHKVMFNSNNLASGVYFYTLKSGGFVTTKKMMILK